MSIKRISKIVTVLVIIATILSAFSMVFASGTSGTSGSGISIPEAKNGGINAGGLQNTVGNVIGIVQFICYAAAVILIVILGIKFMTAAPDAKAEIKKSAVIYVVGAVLVFAAGLLLNLIKNVSNQTVVTT